MIALLQRVSHARVEVDGRTIGQIGAGILMFVCAQPSDTQATTTKLLTKTLKLRIFSDGDGKMNRSLLDTGGALLIVSQFTLSADTASGTRPGFSSAAPPAQARDLYEQFLITARAMLPGDQIDGTPLVQSGQFGAHMKVHLLNDGPVTIPMTVT